MQVSNRKLNKTLERQMMEVWLQLLCDVRDTREMKTILTDLMTESEILAMAKRLSIAVYLDKGRSYEDIKNNLKVSSATIASVAETMGNPGMTEAINRVKADQWADEWSVKLSDVLSKLGIK
jgi:uncharacterized protein YerC